MSWRLVFVLSLFGLAMAFATVFFVPSNLEPLLWLPIFLVCAFAIARGAPRGVFLHGLAVGIVNSVWITAAHIALFDAYVAHHAREASMMASMPLPPRVMMACVGPIIGIVSGTVIGLLSLAARRIVRRSPPVA